MIKDSTYIKGLIDYINDVKPYSSKLVDVAVEYLFDDQFTVAVSEKHNLSPTLASVWEKEFLWDGITVNHEIALHSLLDEVYISLSNYNPIGVATRDAVGAIFNNATTFVPYSRTVTITIDEIEGGVNGELLDGWGGSFNEDPFAHPEIPSGSEDPTDFINGIGNFDSIAWDGPTTDVTAYSDFLDNSKVVTSRLTDGYGYEYPVIGNVAGRTGVLIGTLLRVNVNSNKFYYVFSLNKAYFEAWVPVGTAVKLRVSQRKTTSDKIVVFFDEDFSWEVPDGLKESIRMKSKHPDLYGAYDLFAYDSHGYDEAISDDPAYNVAANMSEILSIQSEPVSGTDSTQIISLSLPNAQPMFSISYPIMNAKKVIINHFMGDDNPFGPYANYGGVIITLVDNSTGYQISNPYINNVPKLFTTTEILFDAPTSCSVVIERPAIGDSGGKGSPLIGP